MGSAVRPRRSVGCDDAGERTRRRTRARHACRLAVRSENGSTRRAYRRLAERFGAWAEARSPRTLGRARGPGRVAAYLVHVAATDGRLTLLQHAVSALRHVARQAGIPDPRTPASRAVLARVRRGHRPGAPPDAEGANVATCPCCGFALTLAPAPADPTRPAVD